MHKDTFEKLFREVSKKISESPTLSSYKIISDVMDKYRIPDDREGAREGYRLAIERTLEMERRRSEEREEIRKMEAAKKLLKKKIFAELPAEEGKKETDISLDDKFTDDLIEGNVSKEDLEDRHFKYRGKKPEDFYFGPPR